MHALLSDRGVFDVDGNSNAWSSFFWKLRSGSVTLKVESPFEQWYYGRLKPWVHYVPVAANLSDVDRAIDYVLDPRNDVALQKMAVLAADVMRGPMVSFEAIQHDFRASLARVPAVSRKKGRGRSARAFEL